MPDAEPTIEPPVMQDGELIVRCARSGCNKTTKIGTDIDAVEASDDRSAWRISFIPTADGRLEVDGVECPDHRVDDAIDDLAQKQYEFAEEFAKTTKVADKLSP
jgi:hypothetical protein